MPWNRPSLQTIYERLIAGIESRLTGGVALLRRAILRILAKVFAGELHLGYGFGEWLSKQLLPDTAETAWLDRHAFIWDTLRKAGAFATGTVRFHGTNTTVIPADTRLVRPDGAEYAVVAEVIITGGQVNAVAQAVVAETASNYPMPGSLQLLSPISGVDSVEMLSDIAGGTDPETDDELRARILQRIQLPPMGGAKHDYVRWALEVDGVSGAWCYAPDDVPVINPGIARVVFKVTGANPVPVPPLYVDNGSGMDSGAGTVFIHIEEFMPVGVELQVFPIDKVVLDFSIKTIPYNSDVIAAVTNNLRALLEGVAEPGRPLLIAHIRDAIMNSGVSDYFITAVTKDGYSVNPTIDIVMNNFEYPVLGSVTVSAL